MSRICPAFALSGGSAGRRRDTLIYQMKNLDRQDYLVYNNQDNILNHGRVSLKYLSKSNKEVCRPKWARSTMS